MNFMFVCGGTAGHINPALAIAGELRRLMPESRFLFIGADREMEKRLIPAEGFELKSVTVSGFTRSLSVSGIKKNLKMLKNISVSMRQSRELIAEFKPDVVIGTGGYVCYPVIKSAAKMGIPTCMHESNAIPGLTAKTLSGTVDKMMVAFPGTEKNYKKPDRVIVTGTPVRGGFGKMTREEAKAALGIPKDEPLVVSFWGSLGAERMNAMMRDFIARNGREKLFRHIHATGGGEKGCETMRSALSERGGVPENCDLRPYILNMAEVMTAADMVLSRSGASTLAELSFLGTPAVLVPSPNVTNDHQTKNARELEKAGGAVLIPESECTGDILFETVAGLLGGGEKLSEMSEKLKKIGVRDSVGKIAETVISLINA